MVCVFHAGTFRLVTSFRESATKLVPGVLATLRRRIHNCAHARQTSADVGVEPHGNQKENSAVQLFDVGGFRTIAAFAEK
jgi:hypothetical protein